MTTNSSKSYVNTVDQSDVSFLTSRLQSKGKHLSLADEIVVLDAKGCVSKQGPFEPMLLTDQATKSEQPGLSDNADNADKSPSPTKKEIAVPKLLTPEIISDMSRQTGDIAVYSYYLRAIGWRLVLGACFIILVYTFSASFPRELLFMR
jgi:ATP-binding cassette, subfamily C (CFTR/MRP), member 1